MKKSKAKTIGPKSVLVATKGEVVLTSFGQKSIKSVALALETASEIILAALSMVLIVAFAFKPMLSSKRVFFSTTSSGSPSLAVSEAIEYSSSGENAASTVDVMVANLYYGTNYDGTVGKLNPGYDFRAITISLEELNGNEILLSYPVAINEYGKMENGILRENVHKVIRDDYSLIYSFDLNEIFQNDYDGVISFAVKYEESRSDVIYSFGKRFYFDFSKVGDVAKLSDFKWDYFSDGYAD
ncbi:MAG: hypothetical protein LKF69_04700 [Bacilli bacterium]|nr:hypothetical protein [Bacilli bacterium]MCH4202405.1 hypothetical protein [Bacilli bacterium]MCH4236078.1 hypothetical protein [Bacilli bacterium]